MDSQNSAHIPDDIRNKDRPDILANRCRLQRPGIERLSHKAMVRTDSLRLDPSLCEDVKMFVIFFSVKNFKIRKNRFERFFYSSFLLTWLGAATGEGIAGVIVDASTDRHVIDDGTLRVNSTGSWARILAFGS